MPRGEHLSRVVQEQAMFDAFGRQRTSSHYNIFDSKQIFDNLPLLYDDQEISGTGTNSVHSAAQASSTISVSTAAGERVRQTFRRFNYQPGKSQLVYLSAVLGTAASGITKRIGLFDDNNGIYFYSKDGVFGVGVRSKTSGLVVDNEIVQDAWSEDRMNGSGNRGRNPSLNTIDLSTTQIFVFDFEWLGVGTVRFGVVVDGKTEYVHHQHHANRESTIYMSTPNLPIRYSIENDGTGPASSLVHLCSTVVSEGGQEQNGITFWVSSEGTHLDANVANTLYAAIGIRLKSAYIGTTIIPQHIAAVAETNDDFEWVLMLNPTVAGTFTYSDETSMPIQSAKGATANTVTGGTPMTGGWGHGGSSAGSVQMIVDTSLLIGSAIDDTVDELVLCVRPLSANLDIQTGINFRALS